MLIRRKKIFGRNEYEEIYYAIIRYLYYFIYVFIYTVEYYILLLTGTELEYTYICMCNAGLVLLRLMVLERLTSINYNGTLTIRSDPNRTPQLESIII